MLAQNPDIIWSKSYGGSEYEQAKHIQLTNDGGFILIGVTPSNDFDVTGYHDFDDIWIVELNSQGTLEWERCYGGSSYDESGNIRQTSDNGYIFCGSTSSSDGDVIGDHSTSDAWLVKIDSLGIIQWQKYYGGSQGELFNDILTIPNGYILIGGTDSNDGDISFNHGIGDAWIVSVDDTGKIIWEKTYGGSNVDVAIAATLTSNGINVAADTYSSDGDLLNANYHDEFDYWVLKLDTFGSIEWSRCFGGSVNDYVQSISKLIDGGYVVGGYTYSIDGDVAGKHGLRDYWVIKINSAGNLEWQKCLGGTKEDLCHSVIGLDDNGIIAAGTSLSTDGDVSFIHDANGDAWIVKLDSSGNLVWEYSYGGTKGDFADELIQIEDGSYVFCGGSFSSDDDLSGNINHGGSDYWIAKVSPSTAIASLIANNSCEVFPNPVSSILTIQSSIPKQKSLIIQNPFGQIVFSKNFPAMDEVIDVSGLPAGIYLLVVETLEGVFTKKVVKD